MTTFKPTSEQQRIIDEGEQWFAEAQKAGIPYSTHFVVKCTQEMGLTPKSRPRKSIIMSVLTRLFLNEDEVVECPQPTASECLRDFMEKPSTDAPPDVTDGDEHFE